MDIGKYIGLFLLKNHFCYVPGFGNLELKKQPGSFDGKFLHAPIYKIEVTPGGSIDDSLAYFVATNEQVSISKASNEIRDFSIQSKSDLEAGKEIQIPGLGKFKSENGRVAFVTDENFSFTPAGLPTIRSSKQLEEQASKPAPIPAAIPIPAAEPKRKTSKWAIILLIVLVVVILGGGGLGYYFYSKKHKHEPLPPEKPYDSLVHQDTMRARMEAMRVADSLNRLSDTIPVNHKVVIASYSDINSAEKYVRELKGMGDNNAEVYVKDTTTYLILSQIVCRNKDTTTVFDSLKNAFKFPDVKSFK